MYIKLSIDRNEKEKEEENKEQGKIMQKDKHSHKWFSRRVVRTASRLKTKQNTRPNIKT
jgi:hypothetical protein